MELKLFSDLIDALGKVVGGLKAVANMPKAEREAIRRTLDETYRLVDTTLNMVIIRLGDILLHTSDVDFLNEVTRLDNYNEWMQAERELRLCRSLRVALRETETLANRLVGFVSTKDWSALLQQMQTILATEGEVALLIAQQFQKLADEGRDASQNSQLTQAVRDKLSTFRGALAAERQKLINQELSLYEIV